MGIYKNVNSSALEVSMEVYYKILNNILDYNKIEAGKISMPVPTRLMARVESVDTGLPN